MDADIGGTYRPKGIRKIGLRLIIDGGCVQRALELDSHVHKRCDLHVGLGLDAKTRAARPVTRYERGILCLTFTATLPQLYIL